jgi:hypothetical protein
MDRLSFFSKPSSDLPTDNPWSSVEPDWLKRRSFLSTVFTHGRSRSADGRDLVPPAYKSVPHTKRSKSSKYTFKLCCALLFSLRQHHTNATEGLKSPMRRKSLENALEILRKYDTVIPDDSRFMTMSMSWPTGVSTGVSTEVSTEVVMRSFDVAFLIFASNYLFIHFFR